MILIKTLVTHIKHEPVCSDIARIATIPDCDILTGGFPCQGFSVANLYRKESDSRNKLYLELVRILKTSITIIYFYYF